MQNFYCDLFLQMSEISVWLQKIGLNSLNLTFWVGVWEFLFKWIISFAQGRIEKKKKKKKYCKKYLVVCALTETEDHINLFQVEVHSTCHLRTSENLWFLIFLGG